MVTPLPLKDTTVFSLLDPMTVTLLGKRICEDVILRILRLDHSVLFWRVLNPMTNVLIRDREEDDKADRGEGHVNRKAEAGATQPQARNSWGQRKPEEARTDSLLESQEGTWPCRHIDFAFWPPELQENKFLLFQATKFVVIYDGY